MTDIQAQLSILIALQEVESEIDKINQRIASLNDEAATLGQAAAEHEAQMAEQQEILDRLKKDYRELDSESKDNISQIEKSNIKLRSIKTNKEYQATLKEIEEIRKRNSGVEDRMLELLDKIESQTGAIKQKETQLAEFVRDCDRENDGIAERIREQEQACKQLGEKRIQIQTNVEPAVLKILEDVKTKVRGLPVAPVEQAVCMGCHLNIPPQLYNELRRYDQLRFCPHCYRIIYWTDKDKDKD